MIKKISIVLIILVSILSVSNTAIAQELTEKQIIALKYIVTKVIDSNQQGEVLGAQSVGSIEAMLSLTGLSVGDTITVTDPVRGGEFIVTNSGKETDGGTVFVPNDQVTDEMTQSNSSTFNINGVNANSQIQWSSFKLCHSTSTTSSNPDLASGDGCYDAIQLHGHGARSNGVGGGGGGGGRMFDQTSGEVYINPAMRSHAGDYDGDGSGNHTAYYRLTESDLRIERVIPNRTIEGVSTKNYMMPEWWGGQPGQVSTDEINWALEAAEEKAAELGTCPVPGQRASGGVYVLLSGMYQNVGVVEMQDCTILKGVQDGVRDGQGLVIPDGYMWWRWGRSDHVRSNWPQLALPKSDELTALMRGAWVSIQGGPNTYKARIVDMEYDGNIIGNEDVFDNRAYTDPASSTWQDDVHAVLQNTCYWNGFCTTIGSKDTPASENNPYAQWVTLENIHFHDMGGNVILGNNAADFGDSYDVKVGNSVHNHLFYGLHFSEGRPITNLEVYGYAWEDHLVAYEGEFRNLVVRDCSENPYWADSRKIFGLRGGSDGAKMAFDGGFMINGFDIDITGCPSVDVFGLGGGPSNLNDLKIVRNGTMYGTPYDGGLLNFEGSNFAAYENVTLPAFNNAGYHSYTMIPDPANGDSQYLIYNFDMSPDGDLKFAPLKYNPWGSNPSETKIFIKDSEFYSTSSFIQFSGNSEQKAAVSLYVKDSTVKRQPPIGSKRFYENVTRTDTGYTDSDTGSVSGQSLNSNSTGQYYDLEPEIFGVPVRQELLQVSGADADRFIEWEVSPNSTKNQPELRMYFSGSAPVTFNYSVDVNPIPAGVVFPAIGEGDSPQPNQTPTPSFIASPQSGIAPLTVAFDASDSTDTDGSIASYSWNFGDGTTATGETTTHTYDAGTYTARLTVTDNDGDSAQATRTITVEEPPQTCTPQVTSTATTPQGFATPFAPTTQTLALTTTCNNDDIEVTLGINNQSDIIYNTGYYWDGSNWETITYEATPGNTTQGAWIRGQATASLPKAELTYPGYILGYMCRFTSGYQCSPTWMIQIVE